MLNWLIFETIGGGSVASCKTLVGGEVVDAPGACWTFIKVRQLMFGLYYSGNLDQVWRPILMSRRICAEFIVALMRLCHNRAACFRRKLHLAV